MVKQTNSKIVREIDKLNENETLAVLEYISQILSTRFHKPTETSSNDELIAALSAERENQRAQQAVEWEKTRRRNNYQRAA